MTRYSVKRKGYQLFLLFRVSNTHVRRTNSVIPALSRYIFLNLMWRTQSEELENLVRKPRMPLSVWERQWRSKFWQTLPVPSTFYQGLTLLLSGSEIASHCTASSRAESAPPTVLLLPLPRSQGWLQIVRLTTLPRFWITNLFQMIRGECYWKRTKPVKTSYN